VRSVRSFLRSSGAWLLIVAVLVVLLAGLAAVLFRAQASSRRDLEQRFDVRGALAARFVQSYVADLLRLERRQSRRYLSGAVAGREDFERIVHAYGFTAAVLLDDSGRVLHGWPRRPSLRGRNLRRYVHMERALGNQTGVSNVVLSAARQEPVVGFATPFPSKGGLRVFSGAFSLEATPLVDLLRNASPIASAMLVVDGRGMVVAAGQRLEGAVMLRDFDANLARSIRLRPTGSFRTGDTYVVSAEIGGTPWRLVLGVPLSRLYEPVSGPEHLVSWLVFAALAIASGAMLVLLKRLSEHRTDLRGANLALARVARTDPLSGLLNRRGFDERLRVEVERAHRTFRPLSLIMLDLDRFKLVNDRHGHEAGDAALEQLGRLLGRAIRLIDSAGRIGGEEFALILPETDAEGACVLGERVRALVESWFAGHDPALTASVGIASFLHDGETTDELLRAADAALYAAKAAGRNRVVLSHGSSRVLGASIGA